MKLSAHTKCIAVFGTGSEVGKSVIAAALCRVLANRGERVAPYKAQNMSNNSGVTPEGLEMGRAQIVQAMAARIPPHVDMNPILLKPTSDVGSQVVLLGRATANRTAAEYHREKQSLFEAAARALDRLRRQYDWIVMEGAGSCAEVNLMDHDIVNFRIAEYADAPVVLVADIHRGGVFGQIVGTLACLPETQQARVAGFVINRFRGDPELFRNGIGWIENKTGKPVFGLHPWYTDIRVESEDSVVIENPVPVPPGATADAAVAVIRLPHISNFTDFDPLMGLDGLTVHFLEKPQRLDGFRAVILPGSKNTRYDLQWLERQGWTEAITRYAESGGHLLGLCGGYQMMGRWVHDPEGLEGSAGSTRGLALLPVDTTLQAPKTTTLSRFVWEDAEGMGYEIHMGRTVRDSDRFLLEVFERNGQACRRRDGCFAGQGRFLGTYIHGFFDSPAVTRRWLDSIGLPQVMVSELHGPACRERDLDRLADHFAEHVDVDRILAACQTR
ncbi:MAG TPA: cobyric acid synthase [Desulfobacterales bacterium]